MSIQRMKVLTSMILLLLAASAYPASARPSGETESMQRHSQINRTQLVRGTIKSIVGDLVTLEMPNGKTQQIIINPDDLGRLNLEQGMQIAVMVDKQNTANKVSVVEANTASKVSVVEANTPSRSSTRVTTTRRQEVITQRRIVKTTPAVTSRPMRRVTHTTEVKAQSTNTRPVRGLW